MTEPHRKDPAPVENRLRLVAEELDAAVGRLQTLVEELKGEIKSEMFVADQIDAQASEQEQR